MMRKIHYIATASALCLGGVLWSLNAWEPAPETDDALPKAPVRLEAFTFLNDDTKSANDEPRHLGDTLELAPAAAVEPAEILSAIDEGQAVVRLVTGAPTAEGVAARVLVGAPGLWPFETVTSAADGHAILPDIDVTTFANQPVYRYELLARSIDREVPVAFWGEYDAGAIRSPMQSQAEGRAAPTVELVAADDLKVRVQDEDGEPVHGVSVRLARDSVSLLSLNVTTDSAGLGVFTRLPPAEYQATFNASGYSRATLTLGHELGGGERDVVLTKGSGARQLDSWRGAVVAEKPRSQPTAPKEAPAEPAAESAAGPPGRPEATERDKSKVHSRELRVFVVDDYGGPVDGALVEVWQDGRLISSGVSTGSRPIMLSASSGAGVGLLAMHSGWGEGELLVGASGDEELVLRLDQPLLSSVIAPGRVHDLDAVEALLGAALVEDGHALLIDATDPACAAIRAGIRRGDALMSVRKLEGGHEVVVDRGGSHHRVVLR